MSRSDTYDANGNTLSDPQGRSFTWDFENRLTQVVNPGVGTTTFRYDPFGRRIQKSGPLGTTNYLYDGGANLIEELDVGGNILARYTQSPVVDQPLAELRSGTASYYQQDALSSVTSLSNSAGAIANQYTYDAVGRLTAANGALTNPFQFTGRELDQETGIDYYRARYYDPNAGRFVSQDPIGTRGGINLYAYVGNNSATFADPGGLKKTCAPVGDPLFFFQWTNYGPTTPLSSWTLADIAKEGSAKAGAIVLDCIWHRDVRQDYTTTRYYLQEYICNDDSITGCHTEYWWPVPNSRTIEWRIIKESTPGSRTFTETKVTDVYPAIATPNSSALPNWLCNYYWGNP